MRLKSFPGWSCFLTFISVCLLWFFVSSVSCSQDSNSEFRNVYLIPVPSQCVYVKKVEKGEVHVESLPGSFDKPECKKSSVIQVKVLPDDNRRLKVYYNGKLWKDMKVDLSTPDSIVDYISELAYEGFYESVKSLSPGSGIKPEDRAKVEESYRKVEEYVNSEEFQNKISAEKSRVARLLGIAEGNTTKEESFYESSSIRKSKKEFGLSSDERIYVFVSKSVPVETLRAYVRDAVTIDHERVIFVLRGGIGGLTYISPTAEWIYDVIVKDPDCNPLEKICEVYPVKFQIDPFLFRRYGINEVPAVVYARGVERYLDLSEGLPETKVSDYYVSYGDVSLFYHLYVLGSASGNERMKAFAERFLNYQSAESR